MSGEKSLKEKILQFIGQARAGNPWRTWDVSCSLGEARKAFPSPEAQKIIDDLIKGGN